MKVSFTKTASVLAIFVALVSAPLAQATLVIPGSTVPVSVFLPESGDLSLITSTVVPVNATTYSGTLSAAVYWDTGTAAERDGIVCPAAACLDFVYQFSNTGGTTPVARETNFDFSGFMTGVTYLTSPAGLPAGGPFGNQTSVPPGIFAGSRDGTGTVVGFQFGLDPTSYIHPGQTSPILIIMTDATMFQPGYSDTIDGGVTQVRTYQPSVIPEPASMILIGGGLLGLAGLKRKRAAR